MQEPVQTSRTERDVRKQIREAREREDLERYQARLKERQEVLEAVKERYSASRMVNNRKNLIWLFFALILAGVAYAVSRFLLR